MALRRVHPQNDTADATIIFLHSEPRHIGDARPDRHAPRVSDQPCIYVLASITWFLLGTCIRIRSMVLVGHLSISPKLSFTRIRYVSYRSYIDFDVVFDGVPGPVAM